MVEFVSLLLGLMIGPVEVELAVGGEVAAVIVELDGAEVGRLDRPPWRLTVDLGERLRPRRLTAHAVDGSGQRIDTATLLLNAHRPPAGVDYALHRNSDGWVTLIELSWPARAGAVVRRSAVSVDGAPVAFEDASKIYPPPLDPGRLHVVEAVAEYTDGSVTRDRFGVGGPVLGESSARLTPVPATLPGLNEPDASAIVARSATTGASPRVVGVERADSELVFVRDAAAATAVRRIAPARASMGALSGARDAQAARTIHALPLASDEWVRILLPAEPLRRDRRLEHDGLALPAIGESPGGFGLLWHLKTVDAEPEPDEGGAWLSDALAVAGSRLALAGRRRAVVLVLGAESIDRGSLLDPAGARGYLEALGVPLYVWFVGKPARAPRAWGEPLAARSVPGLEKALAVLREALERQRVVWVEGVHLPGEVTIEAATSD